MRAKVMLKSYKCKVCNKVLKGKITLSNHMKVLHSENREKFTCKVCKKSFGWKHNLQTHMATNSDKKFLCRTCGSKFTLRYNLKVHMRVHSDPTFKCNVCGKYFRQKDELKMHLKTHEGGYACKNCKNSFSRPHILKNHICLHGDAVSKVPSKTVSVAKPTLKTNHQCSSCTKQFPTIASLTDHQMRDLRKTLQCSKCNKTFPKKSLLKNHLEIKHRIKNRWIRCYFCKHSLLGYPKLVIHMKSHTKEYKFECNVCGMKFENNCELEQHERKHVPLKFDNVIKPPTKPKQSTSQKLVCYFCEQGLFGLKNLVLHMITHTKECILKCCNCELEFQSNCKLKKHQKTHKNPTKQKQLPKTAAEPTDYYLQYMYCGFCDKPFKRKDDFEKHIQTHTREKPFICPLCSECFTNKKGLIHHHKIYHTSRPIKKDTVCKICLLKCKCMATLRLHVKIVHEGYKPFKCYFCTKSFSTLSGLRQHMDMHTKERNSFCKLCGMDFTCNRNLDFHIAKVHIPERPFRCYFCQKGFLSQYLLNNHMIQDHTMERTHSCYFCKLCFSKHVTLQNHMVRHTQERPYQCPECKQCYRNGSNFRYHMAFFQKDVPPNCIRNPTMQTLKYDYHR